MKKVLVVKCLGPGGRIACYLRILVGPSAHCVCETAPPCVESSPCCIPWQTFWEASAS
jgi:hypothetical protein